MENNTTVTKTQPLARGHSVQPEPNVLTPPLGLMRSNTQQTATITSHWGMLVGSISPQAVTILTSVTAVLLARAAPYALAVQARFAPLSQA